MLRGEGAPSRGAGGPPRVRRPGKRCGVAAPRSRARRGQPRSRVHRESRSYIPLFLLAFEPSASILPARRAGGAVAATLLALLVAYRHASTASAAKPFHSSVRPVGVGVLSSFYCFCAAGSALDASRRETGPGAPTALPTGSVSFGRCRRGAAEPYWSGAAAAAGPRASPLSHKTRNSVTINATGPWPRTSTIH